MISVVILNGQLNIPSNRIHEIHTFDLRYNDFEGRAPQLNTQLKKCCDKG